MAWEGLQLFMYSSSCVYLCKCASQYIQEEKLYQLFEKREFNIKNYDAVTQATERIKGNTKASQR